VLVVNGGQTRALSERILPCVNPWSDDCFLRGRRNDRQEGVDIPFVSTATAIISWTSGEGDHELALDVDGKVISEIKEHNNRAVIHLNIAGSQSGPLLLGPDLDVFIPLAGIIVVILVIIMLLRIGENGK
jgi:hypothetical protein